MRGSIHNFLKTREFPMLRRVIVLPARVNDPERNVLTLKLIDLAKPRLLFVAKIEGTPGMTLIDGDP
jgi:hypothetical protein